MSNDDAARSSWTTLASAIVFVALLLGVLQLLWFNTEDNAPFRLASSGEEGQRKMLDPLAGADDTFRQAADGGDLALHFEGLDPNNFESGIKMCRIYFRANYAVFPHRAIVGRGDRVINYPAELAAADVPADEAWLKQHNVRAMLLIHYDPSSGVLLDVKPIK
jgi:hypothetical protein